jgi:hypothetical protein
VVQAKQKGTNSSIQGRLTQGLFVKYHVSFKKKMPPIYHQVHKMLSLRLLPIIAFEKQNTASSDFQVNYEYTQANSKNTNYPQTTGLISPQIASTVFIHEYSVSVTLDKPGGEQT